MERIWGFKGEKGTKKGPTLRVGPVFGRMRRYGPR